MASFSYGMSKAVGWFTSYRMDTSWESVVSTGVEVEQAANRWLPSTRLGDSFFGLSNLILHSVNVMKLNSYGT